MVAMRFHKTPTFLILAAWFAFALSAWAQQKPLTQNQVKSLVRSGLGEEYHAATTLNSQDVNYKQNYERLLHQMKK
jgi:hypothetical protein